MSAGGEQGHVPQSRRTHIRETRSTWGMGDHYLSERSEMRSADRISGPWRYQRIESDSSWVPPDQPEWLSAVPLDFLGG